MSMRKGPRSISLPISQIYVLFRSFRLTTTQKNTHITSHRCSQNVLNALKKALDQGNINNTMQAYEDIVYQSKTINRDIVKRILMLARNGRKSQDLNFVNRVIKDMKDQFQIAPRHFEYHALIYAYGMQQFPEKAYNVLNHMQQEGIQPNLHTYNTLIGCYKRANDLQSAERILEEMKQKNIQPDTVTYNTIMHLLLRLGQYNRVLKLYEMMEAGVKDIKPDMYTCSTVLDTALKAGNDKIASQLCDELLESRKKDEMDINMMNNILRFKASQDTNQALDLYYSLPDHYPHLRPDGTTYNVMLDICLKNGNPGKAYMIFGDMKKSKVEPDIITYGTLIDAEAREGNLKGALELFEDMCSMSIEPTGRVLNSLANIAASKLATTQDLNKLLRLTEKYQQTLKLDAKAYNSLMYGLALHGKSNQVQRIYDSVFRDITCQPDVATFMHLILAYINDDQIDDAMEIYYALREHHKKCRDSSKMKIPIQLDTTFYSTLIASLSNSKIDKRNQQYEPTNDEYDSTPQLTSAMTLFNDMRPLQIQPTKHTYTALLHACGQYRDLYVLNQVHQQIKVDLYLDPDIGIYNSLMDAYNRVGDGETVLDIWQTISQPASMSNIAPDQTSVSIVLDSCGHNGLVYRAKSIWAWLKRAEFKLNTNNYNSYIECLCREKGREGWDLARQLVDNEMAFKPTHGKPTVEEKTVNTLISFAKKKRFDVEEVEELEQWKSKLY